MADADYFLGIDGGGTKCRSRLTDAQGKVLGQGLVGPANMELGIDVAVEAILTATRHALAQAGLDDKALARTDAGLGMAAGNVPSRRKALEDAALPFRSRLVRSDAEIACLGAHRGRDGGVLILGTGSQGIVLRQHVFTTVGGWGLHISDSGSGAALGQAAVRRSLLAHEQVESASEMTDAVLRRFEADPATMLSWASTARPSDWGSVAPIVFDFAARGDSVALSLVHASAFDVERVLERMIRLGAASVSLMGGLAAPTRPYLSERFDSLIVDPEGDALDGALLLARSIKPWDGDRGSSASAL